MIAMSYEDRVRADKEYLALCDLAYELAKETETRKPILDLIYYPSWASPPPEPRRSYMPWANDMRKKAAALLKERDSRPPQFRAQAEHRLEERFQIRPGCGGNGDDLAPDLPLEQPVRSILFATTSCGLAAKAGECAASSSLMTR